MRAATTHSWHIKSLDVQNANSEVKQVKDLMMVQLSRGYIVYPGLSKNKVYPLQAEDVRQLSLARRVPADPSDAL